VAAKYLMRDLIVVLPGITGSVLSVAAGPGRTALWDCSGSALWRYVRSHGESLESLVLADHDPRVAPPATDVQATGLVQGFHGVLGLAKIDGYQALYETLRERFAVTEGSWDEDRPANLVAYPYDWRLSNRAAARAFDVGIHRRLAAWRQHTGEPEAKLILIAHSMGGLVARYWLEVLGGWRECRALVTFGTPFRGSVDALGYLANGYKKSFIDLTQLLLSCPSVYELLPIYRAVSSEGEWYRPREIEIPLVDPTRQQQARRYQAAAADFHEEIRTAVADNAKDPAYRDAYATVPFVGVHQQTHQSARLDATGLTLSHDMPSWIIDDVAGGDGTVPRVSALPIEMTGPFGATFLGAKHGSLQNVVPVLDDLVQRLRQSQSRHLGAIQGGVSTRRAVVDLQVDDLFVADEPVVVRARLSDEDGVTQPAPLVGLVESEGEPGRGWPLAFAAAEPYAEVCLPDLPAGRYRITARPADGQHPMTLPVTDVFEVSG
jgi:pimeloyl-ACP methyl ester carboxylesterase